MAYLTGVADNAFEKAIKRGKTSMRSAQLDELVAAVKAYLTTPHAGTIRAVMFAWDCWMSQQRAEFKDRGAPLQLDFLGELKAAYLKQGIKIDADEEPVMGLEVPLAPQVAINRWSYGLKRGAKLGMTGTSMGVSAAQTATGKGAAAMVVGAAGAFSATGIGLVAVGGALTIAQSVLAISAAWKTKKHKDGLIKLYDIRDKEPFNAPAMCQMIPDGLEQAPKGRAEIVQHDMIANVVLPYIISKKSAKLNRKIATAIPIIGSTGETVRALGKKAWKYARGTLGVHRQNAAGWLAAHLLTCNCLLAQAIVAELYSIGEMEWLKHQPYGSVIELLEVKMKST